jgi:hypothetical protein
MYDILVCAYFENKTSVEIYPKTFGRKIRFFALMLQMLDVQRFTRKIQLGH